MAITKEKIVELLKDSTIFSGVPENFLTWIIERSEIFEFRKDQIIYEADTLASGLYVILKGSVGLDVIENSQKFLVNLVHESDPFGFEILSKNKKRLCNARALTDSIIIKISIKIFTTLGDEFKIFKTQAKMQYQTLVYLLKKPMTWLQPNEAVHYVNREHSFILLTNILKPILGAFAGIILVSLLYVTNVFNSNIAYWVGGIIGGIGLFWGLWNMFDWMNDYYMVTNQRVVFLEKIALFFDTRKETPLSAVLSVTKQTDMFGRIYHYGDVILRTFTGLLKFKNIEHVDLVAAIVEKQWNNHKIKTDGDDEKEVENILLSEMKNIKPKDVPQQSVQSSITTQKGYFPDFISKVLKLRKIEEETIIYRTHWFVLIRKVILPLMALVASLLFFLASIYSWWGLTSEKSSLFISFMAAFGIISFLWLIYAAVDWWNDFFMITPNQLIDIYRKPLGIEERRTAPIRNIQTIEYKRKGIFGLIFNFGTVFIRVGDVEFTFDYVPNPSFVQQEIFMRFSEVKAQDKEEHTRQDKERLAKWVNAYHKVIKEDNIPEDEQQS